MSRLHDAEPAVQGEVLALVRRTAAMLRATNEPSALAACLNEYLRLLPALHHAWVEVAPPAAVVGTAPAFAASALTLPLRAGPEIIGSLRHAVAAEPLDASRLHLLGAMADLIGAIFDHAGRAADLPHARAMLTWVLDQLPFGAACFLPNRAVLAANRGAHVFLDSPGAHRAVEAWLPTSGPAPERLVRAVRTGDRVALVHLYSGMNAAGAAIGTLALFFDLSEKARAFAAAVSSETYRALWQHRPLTLAVLAAADRLAELLVAAGALKRALPVGVEVGPLEADAVGILAPGVTAGALRVHLRAAAELRGLPDLRIGVGELSAAQQSPDDLITAAISALTPAENLQKPAVLLCDTSAAVNESLYVALHGACDAVRCDERSRVPRLLAERVFDAIFAKVELDEWDADVGFLQRTLQSQPGLKAFVVTDATGLDATAIPLLPPGTPVFRKPFQVAAVRSAVQRYLSDRTPAA